MLCAGQRTRLAVELREGNPIDLPALPCHARRMWRAFSLTLDQLGDRAILKVLAKSLLITLAASGLIGWGLFNTLNSFAQDAAARWGFGEDGGWVAGLLTGLTVFFGLIVIFRAIAIGVLNFFADEVVAAVEAKHYPLARQNARRVTIATSVKMALFSVARVLIVNMLLLPAYLFFFVIFGLGGVLFLAINALLFGRDLGEMVAVRHVEPAALKAWLRNSRVDRALLGSAVTGLFMIPVFNIIVPLIGAAMATHLFHGKGGK